MASEGIRKVVEGELDRQTIESDNEQNLHLRTQEQ
jgi:hypothetical protein